MARFIALISLLIAIGIAQIAVALYALSAGSMARWVGTILITGTLFDLAIFVYMALAGRKSRI